MTFLSVAGGLRRFKCRMGICLLIETIVAHARRSNHSRMKIEHCAICGCLLHRSGAYAKATTEGRSHATKHHFVAERFFGRSSNRRGTRTEGIFPICPWGSEGKSDVFCYECHEELLHNPVLLPEEMQNFAKLVRLRGLSEDLKTDDRSKIAGRVRLLNEVIRRGLVALLEENAPR